MDPILDYSSFLTLIRDQGPFRHGKSVRVPCSKDLDREKQAFNKWVEIMIRHFPHWDPSMPLTFLKQGIIMQVDKEVWKK